MDSQNVKHKEHVLKVFKNSEIQFQIKRIQMQLLYRED